MSGRAWYSHYPLDFLGGVVGMPPEEIGAYVVIIDLIYARGGPIPNDPRWLSGNMGASPRKASALVERLVERGKLHLENGLISNRRAADELAKSAEFSSKLQNSGQIGGRKSAEKRVASQENNELGQASLKQVTGHNKEIEDDDEARAQAPAKSLPDRLSDAEPVDLSDMQTLAQECARAAGTRQVDPVQFGRDINLCRDWIAAGADAALILDEIRGGVVACTEPRGVSSLRYFDQRIRTAAAKRKALENGTVPPIPRGQPADELTQRALARMEARRAVAAADTAGGVGLLG